MSRFGSVTVGRRKREGAGLRLREERAGRGERRFGQKRSEEMVSLLVDRGRRTPSRVVVVVVVVVPSTLRLASFFLVPSEQKETLAVQRIHRMLFRLPVSGGPLQPRGISYRNSRTIGKFCFDAIVLESKPVPCFENHFYIRPRYRWLAIFLLFFKLFPSN